MIINQILFAIESSTESLVISTNVSSIIFHSNMLQMIEPLSLSSYLRHRIYKYLTVTDRKITDISTERNLRTLKNEL